MRKVLFEKLLDLGRLSPFELRHLSSQNALCTRYTPMLYSYIISYSKIVKMKYFGENSPRNFDEILNPQFDKLLDVIKKGSMSDTNSWNDTVGDDNCSFEKIMLSSFNFGLKKPKQIRSFFETIVTFASEPLLIFIAELISFWVDNHLQWIIADDWLYQQSVAVVKAMKTQPAIDKGLNVLSKLLRKEQIAKFAARPANMERVLTVSDANKKNALLIILCECEEIAKLLDLRSPSDDSSLSALLTSWITDGQYYFLTEIDGRLRLCFTTTEVKSYNNGEIPRRSNQKQQLRPVYLPQNLPRNLVQHYFGASKLKHFVSELTRQLEQDLSDDPDAILDRRAALWSCGAILSSNIGVNNYGTCLSHILLRNLKSCVLSVRATAFYATNLMARSPYGADLIELESKMTWKVKKRFIGDGRQRQRNSTADSWSTFYWASEGSVKDLYIDSSNPSLDNLDDTIFLPMNSSKEHLVQSIARTCEPDKPLIVSISRQWSAAGLNGDHGDPISILPNLFGKGQFREHRSQSDTTAMEVVSLRQQFGDNTSNHRLYSPMNLARKIRGNSSVSSTNGSLEAHPELPEPKCNGKQPNGHARGWTENLSQSLNEQQLRRGLNRARSRAEADHDMLYHTANGNILKSYARFNKNQSMRKSRTAPSFGSISSTMSTDHMDIEEYQDPQDELDTESLVDSTYDILQHDNPLEYPGTALPNDIHSFLNVGSHGDKKGLQWTPPVQADSPVYHDITGGNKHLHFLSQCKVDPETDDEDGDGIGSVNHVDKIHHDVIRLIAEIVRGKAKLKEKLFLLRDKFPHYFQSIALYNAVVEKLNINNIVVANRQLIHELFDWCRGVDGDKDTATDGLFFSEIESISTKLMASLQIEKIENNNTAI